MFWEDWFKRGSFSRIFREMDRAFEEMFKEFSASMPKELYKERKLPDGSVVKTFGPMIYGYSMTIGPDGKPHVRTFGNVTPGIPFPKLSERREPLVEVVPTPYHIRVLAELPGVEKKDIDLRATETELTISVDTEERKYQKTVELPDKVDPKSADATFRNGVLEVILKRVEGKKPGEHVSIK
jgi:HSP20 family protein